MIYAFKLGFLDIRWVDIVDILLVSVLLYQVYKLLKGSVAVRVLVGFLSLYLIYLVVKAAQMELLAGILGQFMGVGVLAAIIIFSQEIRKFLLILGKTSFRNSGILESIFIWRKRRPKINMNITAVIEAAKSLSGSNTGALMVFSRNTELKFYADSGDLLDAFISKRLLISIFNKYSPLHDGAVILFEGRIKAARCLLPVSERENLPAQWGLRHRAAEKERLEAEEMAAREKAEQAKAAVPEPKEEAKVETKGLEERATEAAISTLPEKEQARVREVNKLVGPEVLMEIGDSAHPGRISSIQVQYVVVIASYPVDSRYSRLFVNQIKPQYGDVKIFASRKRGLDYVYLGGYNDYATALGRMQETRKDTRFKDAWVHIIRLSK